MKSQDQTQRIDGTIALLCAYKVLQDKKDIYIGLNDPIEEGSDES